MEALSRKVSHAIEIKIDTVVGIKRLSNFPRGEKEPSPFGIRQDLKMTYETESAHMSAHKSLLKTLNKNEGDRPSLKRISRPESDFSDYGINTTVIHHPRLRRMLDNFGSTHMVSYENNDKS